MKKETYYEVSVVEQDDLGQQTTGIEEVGIFSSKRVAITHAKNTIKHVVLGSHIAPYIAPKEVNVIYAIAKEYYYDEVNDCHTLRWQGATPVISRNNPENIWKVLIEII